VTMLKHKCSVLKRIRFPTFWYNCYYFTWSDTYFIQLETLLINHPSYIGKYSPECPIRVLLMMSAPFAFPPKRTWNNYSGIGSLCARPNGWEIELSKIIRCHLICHLYSRMPNILTAKTIKRMGKCTLWLK